MRLSESETNTQTQIHVIIRISTWIYGEAVYSQLKNVEIVTLNGSKVRLIEVNIVFKC